MTYKHAAIAVVLITIALGLGWDAWIESHGIKAASWCQAFRDLNAATDGLLGLCFVALVIHVLCVQWFPAEWRHG